VRLVKGILVLLGKALPVQRGQQLAVDKKWNQLVEMEHDLTVHTEERGIVDIEKGTGVRMWEGVADDLGGELLVGIVAHLTVDVDQMVSVYTKVQGAERTVEGMTVEGMYRDIGQDLFVQMGKSLSVGTDSSARQTTPTDQCDYKTVVDCIVGSEGQYLVEDTVHLYMCMGESHGRHPQQGCCQPNCEIVHTVFGHRPLLCLWGGDGEGSCSDLWERDEEDAYSPLASA
jgi:hypothetical protein